MNEAFVHRTSIPSPTMSEVPGFAVEASDGGARAGRLWTSRHSIDTPAFMPVGTRASVRTVTSADLEDLGAGIVLGNTYHLMLRPGEDLIRSFGGLHGFADWQVHNRVVPSRIFGHLRPRLVASRQFYLRFPTKARSWSRLSHAIRAMRLRRNGMPNGSLFAGS